MHKKLFFPILFLFTALSANSQYKDNSKQNLIDIGVGGIYTTFQDTRFSDVRYSGFGGKFMLDYTHWGKFIWGLNAEFYSGDTKGKTHGKTASNMGGFLSGDFLFPVTKNERSSLYIGPKVDFINMYLRSDPNLINNSGFIISGNSLLAELLYKRKINEKWRFEARGALQLISYMYLGTSFAYAAPQNQLDDGEYNYNGIETPGYATLPWDFFNIETDFRFKYKKRWSAGYQWNMQQEYSTPGMPMTKGYHSLFVAFSVLNKIK